VTAHGDCNPEGKENANKGNHAKCNATRRLQSNLPQGHYESMDGKELAKCTLVGLRPKDIVVERTMMINAIPT
jgi:hypothetical protein